MPEKSQRSVYEDLKRKSEIDIEPYSFKTRKLGTGQPARPRIEFNGSDTDPDSPPHSSRDFATSKQLGNTTHVPPASAGSCGNTQQRQRTPFFFDSHSDSDEDTVPRSTPESDTSSTIGSSTSMFAQGELSQPVSMTDVQQDHLPWQTDPSPQYVTSSPILSSASSRTSPTTTSPTNSFPAASPTSALQIAVDKDDSSHHTPIESDADDDTSEDEDQDDKVEVEMEQLRHMREQMRLHIQRQKQKQAEEKAQAELVAAQEKVSLEAMAAIGKANRMKEPDELEQQTKSTKPARPHSAPTFGQTWKQGSQESGKMASVSLEQAATLMRRQEPRQNKSTPLYINSAAIQKIQLQARKDSERRRARPAVISRPPDQIKAEAQQDIEQRMNPSMAAAAAEVKFQHPVPTRSIEPSSSQDDTANATSTVSPTTFLRLRPTTTTPSKNKNLRSLQPSEITEHDWYLVTLFSRGLRTIVIIEMMQEKFGIQRSDDYYRTRYHKMQMTFPDEILPLKEARRRFKQQEEDILAGPVHTKQDVLAAIYGQPTTADGPGHGSILAGPSTEDSTLPLEMTQNTTSPRPTTGGKTISAEMVHYYLSREPTPESETETEPETEPISRRRVIKLAPKLRQEIDFCYYVYTIHRKTVYPEFETEWVTVGLAFISKKKANEEAKHEKNMSRSDDPFKPIRTSEETNEETGMYSCTAIAKDRTVHVQVQRRLQNNVDGATISGTDDWLPRRMFEVFERRTVTTTVTERVAVKDDSVFAVAEVVQDAEISNELDQPSDEQAPRQDHEQNGVSGAQDEDEQTLRQDHEQNEVTGAQDQDEAEAEEEKEPSIELDIDDLFDEAVEMTEATPERAPAEKHVHFAKDVKPPAEDVSDLQTQDAVNATATATTPATVARITSDDATPTTTLREFTDKASTITITSIPPPTNAPNSSQPLYSTPHIANDAAITYFLSLLHSPPPDDASLCALLPGKNERTLDRINYIKRNEQIYQEKLDRADVTLDAQADERGGEDLEGGLISEVIEGEGITTVLEKWPDLDEDEDEDEEDYDDDEGIAGEDLVKRAEKIARAEEREERKVKKWTYTRTVVEVWVQARTVVGPRNA